jgi:predicted nucleic acid-binding protein
VLLVGVAAIVSVVLLQQQSDDSRAAAGLARACERQPRPGELEIETITPADARRIAELIETYPDFGLGGTDASLIAIAERLKLRTLATLDRRHFSVLRHRHTAAFELVP